MNVTYLHHSGFLVETARFYYVLDYEQGSLPELDPAKPILVLSSHSHADHYNPAIFPMLKAAGMTQIRAILSDDITIPPEVDVLWAAPEKSYDLGPQLSLTTFRSTDLGVAFLIADQDLLIYHAGDLNDWVWEEESEAYNRQMTEDYRRQIALLAQTLGQREIDASFLVLDPRQEADYDRGLCWFLEHIPAKQVYPMHYWDQPAVIDRFLTDHPQYRKIIQQTE